MKLTLLSSLLLSTVLALPQEQITFNSDSNLINNKPIQELLTSTKLSPLFNSLELLSSNDKFNSLSVEELNLLELHVNSLTELRSIQIEENGIKHLIKEGEKALLVANGIKFMDVTEDTEFVNIQSISKDSFPTKLSYSLKNLSPLYDTIDVKQMKDFLISFSTFFTRYYRSATGRESQLYLLNYLQDIAATNKGLNITFSEFPHSWGQNTVIARFEVGSFGKQRLDDVKSQEEIVILGAHQDSTSFLPFMRSPG